MQAPGTRRGELDEIRQGPRAALLREPEQHEQDLRGRPGVRQRAMTRLGGDAEELGERREPDAPRALAEHPPREPHRVDDGGCNPASRQELDLAIEEREVEARVVRDDRRVAGELEQTADRELRPRCPAKGRGVDPGQRRDGGRQRRARVDERLERVLELELTHALRADLADPRRSRREPRRLEIDDDEVRVLEEDVLAGWRREPDGGAAPGEPGVALDDVVEERARDRRWRARERVEQARGLVCRHRPSPELDQLDEPVRGIEGELHTADRRRTYVRSPVCRCSPSVFGCRGGSNRSPQCEKHCGVVAAAKPTPSGICPAAGGDQAAGIKRRGSASADSRLRRKHRRDGNPLGGFPSRWQV